MKSLKQALINCETIQDEGVYINFNQKDILPQKCSIKIDATTSRIKLYVVRINAFIVIKNEDLKKILDIK